MSSLVGNGLLRSLDLCFLDIETTGSVFEFHEIIEIGAVRTSPSGNEVRGTWRRRLLPKHPERITPKAAEVTGFSADSWGDAVPSDSALWSQFTSFAKDCVPVCHNPSFDRAFITLAARAAGRSDLGLDYHWIGTESLGWPLYLSGAFEKLSLASLCQYLGVPEEPSLHNALDGALACRRVYLALMHLNGRMENMPDVSVARYRRLK
jgi:DNA polymerase III epsilon subunit-like protein